MVMVRKLGAIAACLACIMGSPANATVGLDFSVSGHTFVAPWTLTNTSTSGEQITGFGLTLNRSFFFDTVSGVTGLGLGQAFTPLGSSNVTTGYTGAPTVTDGAKSLFFSFDDFGAGETFDWLIDVDAPGFGDVFGNALAGSKIFVQFSDGSRVDGVLTRSGVDGSGFVFGNAAPAVPEPATWAMMLMGFLALGATMRKTRLRTQLGAA